MSDKLISFHGEAKIKEQKVLQLQAHYAADEIVQGTYWQNGKGCAVGCTVHSDSHAAYETEMGIPRILARLEDRIFEGLPNDKAKEFPLKFIQAIPVGVNLEPVWRKLMIWLLTDVEFGVIKYAKTPASKKAIQDVSDAFNTSLNTTVERSKWMELRKAAADAAAAAAYAAYAAYAADADADAAAAAAAYAAYAAYAAAAAYAADADAAAAYAAAAYAADAAAAYADAKKSYYIAMAEKLLQLLSEAK